MKIPSLDVLDKKRFEIATEAREQPRDKLGRFGSTGNGDSSSTKAVSGMEGDPSVIPLENELFEANASFNDSLTDEQISSIKDYMSLGYQDMNTALRGAPPPPPSPYKTKKALEKSKVLEKTIDAAPGLAKEVTVYRGLSEEAFDALKARTGKTFTDKGFASTSLSLDRASNFNRSGMAMLRIKVPKGAKAIPVEKWWKAFHGRSEHEILIQRGSRFKITKAGKDFIDVELVTGS